MHSHYTKPKYVQGKCKFPILCKIEKYVKHSRNTLLPVKTLDKKYVIDWGNFCEIRPLLALVAVQLPPLDDADARTWSGADEVTSLERLKLNLRKCALYFVPIVINYTPKYDAVIRICS